MKPTSLVRIFLAAALVAAAGFAVPADAGAVDFTQSNLVSDIPGVAPHTDADLVNPWGLAFNPDNGPFWVANNGTGAATLYDGLGAKQPLTVTLPPAGNATPTGQVFNSSPNFAVSSGGRSGASRFIFVGEDGIISGWNPNVNATSAVTAASNNQAAYKGAAISHQGANSFLYAANFSGGAVDVFDRNFNRIGSFTDPTVPNGFAPFNTQVLNGQVYVSYARQSADRREDVPGAGNGFVSVFTPDGQFVRRVASGGALNSPWGMAIAPENFGQFSNDLLVGNFGDGRINVFDPNTGAFLGQLRRPDGSTLEIDGLWALTVGNGALNALPNSLYFTAGIDDERHGLFGVIQATPEPSTFLLLGAGMAGLGLLLRKKRTGVKK